MNKTRFKIKRILVFLGYRVIDVNSPTITVLYITMIVSLKNYIFFYIFRKYSNLSSFFQLCKVLCDKIHSTDIVKVLDEILQAFYNTEKFSENKLKVVKGIIKTLGSSKVSNSHAEEIISLIAMDFPNFSKNCLIQLVQFSTSNIYSNKDNFYRYNDIYPLYYCLIV